MTEYDQILAEVCETLSVDALTEITPSDIPAIIHGLIERCAELRGEVARLERVEVELQGTHRLVERLGLDAVLKGASSPAHEEQIRAWFAAREEVPRG